MGRKEAETAGTSPGSKTVIMKFFVDYHTIFDVSLTSLRDCHRRRVQAMPQLGSKKSRRGCTNCKRRRIKCDEEIPCNSCVKRGEACSLAGVSPSSAGVSIPQQRFHFKACRIPLHIRQSIVNSSEHTVLRKCEPQIATTPVDVEPNNCIALQRPSQANVAYIGHQRAPRLAALLPGRMVAGHGVDASLQQLLR